MVLSIRFLSSVQPHIDPLVTHLAFTAATYLNLITKDIECLCIQLEAIAGFSCNPPFFVLFGFSMEEYFRTKPMCVEIRSYESQMFF